VLEVVYALDAELPAVVSVCAGRIADRPGLRYR